jgi:hypothetical protein
MDTALLKLIIIFFVLATLGSSLVAIMIYYRRYYRFLKANYSKERQRLMNKDPAIANAGEWIRWPVGSAQLFFSIFNKSSIGDLTIKGYKSRLRKAFVLFIVSFIGFLILAGILPKIE